MRAAHAKAGAREADEDVLSGASHKSKCQQEGVGKEPPWWPD